MATILVAEDESSILELVRMVLSRRGHRVIEAASGTAAWNILSQDKPDLLILDVMLPGLDGHSLQMKLSQDENLKELPVIVMSALNYTADMFSKFPQVKGFLAKPFTPLQLDEMVGRTVSAPAL